MLGWEHIRIEIPRSNPYDIHRDVEIVFEEPCKDIPYIMRWG